jgi:hypothetical protein
MDLNCVHTSVANGVFGGEQTIILSFDNRIALAYLCFQLEAIEYGNVAAAAMDQSRLLQLSSGLRDAFAAHAQHMSDQFLRHRQLIRGRPVQA